MSTLKGFLIIALLVVGQKFASVTPSPLLGQISNDDNSLRKQEFLKSQYETFPLSQIPIYYNDRGTYFYPKTEDAFGGGHANLPEVVEFFEGYVYNRPEMPFTYPPKTTTEMTFPPATARIVSVAQESGRSQSPSLK